MILFLQILANGLVNAAVYVLLAISFGLVWRSLRIFHVAFAGLYVLNAYLFLTFVSRLGMAAPVALVATILCAVVIGALVELWFYRAFISRQAGSGPVLIASLGLYVVIENALAMTFGNEIATIPRGLVDVAHLGPVELTLIQLLQFTTGVAVTTLLLVLIQRRRLFKALWAIGDQPELIPVLGLPIRNLRIFALAASTGLLAIPASLITLDIGVDPHVGLHYLLIATVSVIAGGLNSLIGWIVGAVVLALVQSLAVWQFSARWMDLVTFAFLIFILVLRPTGVIETVRRLEEA
jgi:branched-chain amino acid transport system permease protein